ncbi:MAG: hypothetical protein DCF28_01160 [Alphaproteobacteria bacterium]|nr:MAG: hypothetical protein DCF28_01160 [Alphaproteobacteria bacterium]PZO36803.1 MAG: hypothetical protein DCE92_08545 [Alphaproteobacteria bacterium]
MKRWPGLRVGRPQAVSVVIMTARGVAKAQSGPEIKVCRLQIRHERRNDANRRLDVTLRMQREA